MYIIGIFFNKELRTGGHKRYFELLTGLANRGHKVRVLHDPFFSLPGGLYSLPIDDFPFFLKKATFRNSLRIHRYYSIIKDQICEADWIIVFGETHMRAAVLLKRRLHIPILCSIRSNSIEELKASLLEKKNDTLIGKLKSVFRRVILSIDEKFLAWKADKIVLQSNYEFASFLSRNPRAKNKTSIIRNNITASWFDPKYRYGNQSIRLERLLFIGALNERKGIIHLLEAFYEVSKKNNNLELTIIGFGPYEKRVLDFIASHSISDRIKLLGKISNVFPILIDTDLLIVPSLYDSYPNVILEALHTGTPVIGSRCGGITEMLQDESLLFDPGSAKAISDRISDILSDKSKFHKIRNLCCARGSHFAFDWVAEFESLLLS